MPQNDQTHSIISPTVADELFGCVCPFCGVGAERIKDFFNKWRSELSCWFVYNY